MSDSHEDDAAGQVQLLDRLVVLRERGRPSTGRQAGRGAEAGALPDDADDDRPEQGPAPHPREDHGVVRWPGHGSGR